MNIKNLALCLSHSKIHPTDIYINWDWCYKSAQSTLVANLEEAHGQTT